MRRGIVQRGLAGLRQPDEAFRERLPARRSQHRVHERRILAIQQAARGDLIDRDLVPRPVAVCAQIQADPGEESLWEPKDR